MLLGAMDYGGYRAPAEPLPRAASVPVNLGAITADQAAQQAMPKSSIRSTAGFTPAVYNDIVQAAEGGQIVGLDSCSSSGSSTMNDLKLVQQGTSLALTGTTIGLSAAGVASAAALAPFTLGISAIIGLLPMIFSHHAQAVAKERQVECALVPAANNYLNIIRQAVQSGQATPQQAIDALNSLLRDFQSQIASITKNTASSCNAGCVWSKELQAIVAYQISQYQDMAAAAQSQVTSSGPSSAPAVTSGSTMQLPVAVSTAPVASTPGSSIFSGSNWLPIAALALFALFAIREF